jgi:hypothetical protein
MMKRALSICGCTKPSRARLPIDWTHRWCGPPIETAPVLANQDRTFPAPADGQIDGAGVRGTRGIRTGL